MEQNASVPQGRKGRPTVFSRLPWSLGSCLPITGYLGPRGPCLSSYGPVLFKPFGTRRGHRSGFPGTPLAAAVLLALRMGGAEESPFPGCFWVGVSNEVPGGVLNLPQECRRVHMPTFSTLFSMHRHRQAEEKRRAPFSQKGILFSGLNPVGDTKVPVWVGPPQTQHVEHRACDSTSFQPRMG